MVWFMIGSESEERMQAMLDWAELLDGLKEITTYEDDPLTALLGFETREQARTAQWLLEVNGAEGR